MQYILFMMFLITAPGQSIPKDKRLFTLQSTQSIEFASPEACIVARDSIADSIAITDTILLVSSCLPKGQVGADASIEADKQVKGGPATKSPDNKSKTVARPRVAPDSNGIIQFNTMSR